MLNCTCRLGNPNFAGVDPNVMNCPEHKVYTIKGENTKMSNKDGTITVVAPWNTPYGEASWIGTTVFKGSDAIGEVIDEGPCCKRTCVVTIKLFNDIYNLENAEDFEVDTVSHLVIDPY